ncbi:RDD family protein [Microbacterium laevaniformans]|uniref:RDD family protein n=1 Tax=Microbacterium laevaniformans TaxID=36807 RepID=UPI003D965C1A
MTDLDLVRRPAQVGRRVGAYLIDAAIGMVVLLIAVGVFAGISFGTGGALPLPLAVALAYVIGLCWFVVYTLMQAGAGSLGMRALGLRLVREGGAVDASAPASRLGFGRALGRNLVWALGGAIVVGYFSPLFDSSPWHRGWHDRAVGAVMTDVAGRSPVPPADSRAEAAPPSSPSSLAPTVLPAAPILPEGPAPELGGWSPAEPPSPVRSTPLASGVISFVPGVSDADRLDQPAPAPAPGLPTVEVSAATPPVSGAPAADRGPVSGAGVVIESIDETRISTGERPFARLVWDDGTRQALYGRTLFGRNPAPETGAMVSPVRDETLSLSKTHFEMIPDDDRTVWVVDRHSTNGVAVRRGDDLLPLEPGERTRVRAGDVLVFGDRQVTVEVTS